MEKDEALQELKKWLETKNVEVTQLDEWFFKTIISLVAQQAELSTLERRLK
jgi:hypothetical protein